MENSFVFVMLFRTLPWYNCTGWLGAKHQVTDMLLDFLCFERPQRNNGAHHIALWPSLFFMNNIFMPLENLMNSGVFQVIVMSVILCDVFSDFDYCQINSSTWIMKSCCITLCLVYSYHLSFKLPWPVRSDFHLLSGISGPSFDSPFLSHLLFFPPSSVAISVLQFFCQWFIFLSFFQENSQTFFV